METQVIGISHWLPTDCTLYTCWLRRAWISVFPDRYMHVMNYILNQLRFAKIYSRRTCQTLQVCPTGLCICQNKRNSLLFVVFQEFWPLSRHSEGGSMFLNMIQMSLKPLLTLQGPIARPESDLRKILCFGHQDMCAVCDPRPGEDY